MVTKVYACINQNSSQRLLSSSGGVYPLIAEKILKQNGIVFAACYNEKLEVVHKAIIDEVDLSESQGSKYVCSKLGNIFKAIIDAVNFGRQVLFVGTPCQCAGLISFLAVNHIDREKVLVIDFVCHGVPGRRVWEGYKESLKKAGKKLATVNMRDKSSGWSQGNYSWKETTVDGRDIVTPRREVAYMKGMLSNLYLRPSCYECFFKGIDRETDFTLGDCWGIWNYNPEMDDNKGTSLLLIHTKKGNELFDSIRTSIKFVDVDIERIVLDNACIVRSTSQNEKRREFFTRLNQGEDFIKLVNDLTRLSLLGRTKQMLKSRIKKVSNKFGGGISNLYLINFCAEVAV